VDVAATLEVRGYGAARRPPRTRRPWSRHDLAFATATAALLAVAVAAATLGWEPFEAYPRTDARVTGGVVALAAGLAALALAPFAQRKGTGTC
jgi:energy-coupling factor transport system permease protein